MYSIEHPSADAVQKILLLLVAFFSPPCLRHALSGPKGASSPSRPRHPSSRGTSTVAPVSGGYGDGTGIAYEEPHAGAEAGREEAVERADRVDVDGVAAVAMSTGGASHSSMLLQRAASAGQARVPRMESAYRARTGRGKSGARFVAVKHLEARGCGLHGLAAGGNWGLAWRRSAVIRI